MKIEIKQVMKKFKNEVILDNVNMQLNGGHIYGFVGRNGSGKSVFLKMLCGFYIPTSGEILFDGINIIKEKTFPPSTRALIEKPNFLSDLTGYENLKLLAEIQNKISSKEIETALKKVNLDDQKNKRFSKYSLGMKQKLGIAQVLMENPDVLIFDEPFNGIESSTVEKLRKEFLAQKDSGKLIIVSSHIKEDIDMLADEIYEFADFTVKKL
ncbi:MAG: ABC transporter ATP-binding protein [Bacilli bacterium]